MKRVEGGGWRWIGGQQTDNLLQGVLGQGEGVTRGWFRYQLDRLKWESKDKGDSHDPTVIPLHVRMCSILHVLNPGVQEHIRCWPDLIRIHAAQDCNITHRPLSPVSLTWWMDKRILAWKLCVWVGGLEAQESGLDCITGSSLMQHAGCTRPFCMHYRPFNKQHSLGLIHLFFKPVSLETWLMHPGYTKHI